MDNLILTHEHQGVFTITLNRLDKKNALNTAMYQSLIKHFAYASESDTVHCLLIQGDQNCFTAGNDLQDFIESAESGDLVAMDFVRALAAFDKPIIAAVAGVAVGIGTTLLLHCDMVVAANNSHFKLPFTQLGLCPEAGSSLLLTQRLGHNRAFELLVLGKSFEAEQALEYGLVNQVCQPDEVLSRAATLAAEIAALPQDAVKTSRALIHQASQAILPAVIENEGKEFVRLMATDSCKNILAKFFK
ncbi:enoyl-CoA hydratase-related protein [Thalassomonas sp. RHCl1]|uniref:enoyl-CoA hydratase-related protein n=1 Tax=Thalassomonas sp. RHCl1 TaxID=2995320 RepID=UPI00248CAEC2|nr:enoyl-CoA hydratase-related protein [Thalassomonas sp. RHCl1]